MAKFKPLILALIWSTIYVMIASKCITFLLRADHCSYSCTNLKSSELGPELINLMKDYKDPSPIKLLLSKIKLPDSFNDELRTGWFHANVSIRYLHVRLFNITKIGADAFRSEPFEELKELIITNIPSLTFTNQSFNGLNNLKKLNMVGIKQFHFEANVLAPVANLQVLIIECNDQETLLLDNLLGTTEMYQLIQVRIFHCNLKDTITETTFTGLKSVIELNLSNNDIERLGERSFDVVLQTMHYLHLPFNKLTSLPVELFENRRDSFLQITAQNNPWNCDSIMEKLHKFIHSDSNIKISTIICKTPPKCNGFQVEVLESFCYGEKLDGAVTREGIERAETSNAVPSAAYGEEMLTKESHLLENEEKEFQKISTDSLQVSTIATPEANHGDLYIKCKLQNKTKKLTLSKPSVKKFPSIHSKNAEVEVDAAGASTDYQLVAIEETSNTNHQTLSCLTSVNIDEKKMVDLNQHLKSNRLHRFCWMEKGIDTIAPLDCFAFHFHLKGVKNAWLMVQHKPIAIVIFTLVATLGFIIGILVAILLVKRFTKKKSEEKLQTKMSVKKTASTILMRQKRRVHFQPVLTMIE